MQEIETLPSLTPIPDEIETIFGELLNNPANPALEDWLLELIRSSGHLSTSDNLRWRVLAMIWLTQFDIDKAWPYLMWLNMNEPVMSDHLNEILTEAVIEYRCHILLVNWIASCRDERLTLFFSSYRHIPGSHEMASLLRDSMIKGIQPETGVWLASYCRNTADSPVPHIRPWRLVTAAWYATCYNHTEGLMYLKAFTNNADTLSNEDNSTLRNTLSDLNTLSLMIQWIADCPNKAVRQMLEEVSHPDLISVVEAVFDNPPDYSSLTGLSQQAVSNAQSYLRNVNLLEQIGVRLDRVEILDMACGPLAPHTLLFNSSGCTVTGVDLEVPPAFLPISNLKQRFKRSKYVKAWQEATKPYYKSLAQEVSLKLKWKGLAIELADLTRLRWSNNQFDLVICCNYLQHAPDVSGLLAEVARVLKPGGYLLADIVPFRSLYGAGLVLNNTLPWAHLRKEEVSHKGSIRNFNRWSESQYKIVLEQRFTLLQWLTEQIENAHTYLSPEIRAELPDYTEEELTRGSIVVLAQK